MKKLITVLLAFSFCFASPVKDEIQPEDIDILISLALDSSSVLNDSSFFDSKIDISIKIDLVEKSMIQNRIRIFKKRGLKKISYYLDRGKRYIPLIKEIFDRYSIPDEFIFLPIIESHFNIRAKSPAGAAGLWQFMPQTARMYGLTINKWIDERYDVEKSTIAAALYLKDLYGIFEDWTLALASYNTGEGVIIRKINKYGGLNFWDIDEYLSKETRNYVPNFLATVSIVRELLQKEHFDYKHMEFDILRVNKPVSLRYIASLIGYPVHLLREMNPHLKKGITPPYEGEYNVYIPKGYRETLEVALEKAPLERYPALKEYTVKKGDSLGKIAKKFGITVSYLKKINDIQNTVIMAGSVIKVPSYITAYPDYYDSIIDLSEDIIYTPKGIIYKVKKGDTLGKIAKKFRVSISAIKRWNRIKGFIYPNQRIIIYKRVKYRNTGESVVIKRNISYLKRKVKKRKPTFRYIFYRVKKGDSLLKIAKKYGVSVGQIKQWNRLKGNVIRVGQKITIIKRTNDG
ncbi:LysM peptidoglycan-binding domain-containing protein [Persephonella atlantica]|uniref:LysM peptidoglycan-binding domain-containing protein n=1 Tax=Persephonella atlantica TaxID=2699429 RepID=A0ABS1GF34_9AQUI|nr:lytic transglycosylase domain-containing protein [Persephonella atlantica]MBK3331548.1 LysM peptidoglycan-binding domain-containing protein [Persephonella atlantica]